MLTPLLSGCELFRLFRNRDAKAAAKFLADTEHVDLSRRDSDGMSVLHYAAAWGCQKTMQILLRSPQCTSYLNIPEGQQGDTALIIAARYQQDEALLMLLNAGADANWQNDKRESVLFWAVKHNRLALTRMLLQRGAEPNHVVRHGFTPLILAVIERRLDLVTALVEGGSDINLPDDRGHRPLSWAIISDDISIAAALLSNETVTPPISTSPAERSPLIWAVIVGNYEMVRLLINHGADISQQQRDRRPPLIWAVIYRNLPVAELLLQSGAPPDELDGGGQSALAWALLDDNQEMVHLLCRHGASQASWERHEW
jgi:ankyrin repeat protein